jgi:inorganic pyrophosphatase
MHTYVYTYVVGGDNDPLDVCEIGLRQIETGKVRPVKVLDVHTQKERARESVCERVCVRER